MVSWIEPPEWADACERYPAGPGDEVEGLDDADADRVETADNPPPRKSPPVLVLIAKRSCQTEALGPPCESSLMSMEE